MKNEKKKHKKTTWKVSYGGQFLQCGFDEMKKTIKSTCINDGWALSYGLPRQRYEVKDDERKKGQRSRCGCCRGSGINPP